jgi:hypothetical protein
MVKRPQPRFGYRPRPRSVINVGSLVSCRRFNGDDRRGLVTGTYVKPHNLSDRRAWFVVKWWSPIKQKYSVEAHHTLDDLTYEV